MRLRIAPLAAAVAALALPAGALAGTPGHWTRLTPTTGDNTDQVDLARTPDGVLHAVFQAKNAADRTHDDVFVASVQANGAVSAPVAVQQNWATIENPAIVLDPGGLRTFWGGIRTTNFDETNKEISTATAPAGGSPWTLTVGNVTQDDASYGGNVAATVAAGQFWQTWAGTLGVFVHRSLDPNAPDANLQTALGGCCDYDPGIVTDPRTGAPVIAWSSNASGKRGVWVQSVDTATGSPVGAPRNMPGSTTGGQFDQEL